MKREECQLTINVQAYFIFIQDKQKIFITFFPEGKFPFNKIKALELFNKSGFRI